MHSKSAPARLYSAEHSDRQHRLPGSVQSAYEAATGPRRKSIGGAAIAAIARGLGGDLGHFQIVVFVAEVT